MIIQAELRRKQSEYEGEPCAVDKVIELPSPRFQQFSRALLADYAFSRFHDNVGLRNLPAIRRIKGTDAVIVNAPFSGAGARPPRMNGL